MIELAATLVVLYLLLCTPLGELLWNLALILVALLVPLAILAFPAALIALCVWATLP